MALGLAVSAPACRAPARIPYDLSQVQTRARPVHPIRVALLPLVDGRQVSEAPDARGRYLYNGRLYDGTRLERLGRAPLDSVTEVVARHLARSRVFAQVVLVRRADQAPEADLVMTGRVRRLRGYVEAEPPPEESGRPTDERHVLAEVVLEDLVVRPANGAPRLELDVGWSIAEMRRTGTSSTGLDPWAVMAEALTVSLQDLTREIAAADLSGAYEVPSTSQLGRVAAVGTSTPTDPFDPIAGAAPQGWQWARTSTASTPDGWRGPAECAQGRFQARQTLRFSRALGPYRPQVVIWACPRTARLKFDGRAERPARLWGHAGGRWYFGLQVGRTKWLEADRQIAKGLALTPPPHPHVFELGPGVDLKTRPRPQPGLRRGF